MTTPPLSHLEATTDDLGHYGMWIQAWFVRSDLTIPPVDSLTQLNNQLVTQVADRVRIFEAGHNDDLELPIEGTTEEMAIAAEMQPLMSLLNELTLPEGRDLTAAETQLLQAETWGDRPSIAQLRDQGQVLAELIGHETDLDFTPTAYLPSELRVIAQGAELTVAQLYRL